CLFGIRGRRGYNPIKVSQMKGSDIPLYNGLPTVLKGEGYRTMFFMTHESQYDNMNAFFRTNGYEEIYSQENYPRDKVVNSFGVQDDFLFSFAIDRLKTQRQPFFATLLSLLGIGAEQNNFGVDLLARRRPCAFYTADNVIGARSEDRLFVFNPSTEQTFLYLDGELQHTEDSAFNALRQHAFSMLQAAQYVVGKGETQ
ncbi:MAG: hypothetical protein LUC33_00795, partial [Prevotellaceae bacterium]|nr:hypothetical protein [Prevotellaceae bacterium]